MNNEEELRKDLAFTIWLLEQMELYPEQYSEFNKKQLLEIKEIIEDLLLEVGV